MQRVLFDEDHLAFRKTVVDFLVDRALPLVAEWDAKGLVDRWLWEEAGKLGLLSFETPEQYGGAGVHDFRYNVIVAEALMSTGVGAGPTFTLHNDVMTPYFTDLCNSDQQQRWLPGLVSGTLLSAIAMTEPDGGSDLRGMKTVARRDGDEYVVSGSKTFITNGVLADVVIVAAKTDPAAGAKGISLIAVERGTPGFENGRKLSKAGLRAQDTAELFFNEVRVPVRNLIGVEGHGFDYLMRNLPRERMSIAVTAVAAAERALHITTAYCRERLAFGKPIGNFQANQFAIAEMHTTVQVARAYVDRCVLAVNTGDLSAAEAAGAKQWTTDMQCEVIDQCLQLHGGYGFMDEYEISRMWRDGRVQKIYGGTNEIMKHIVGKSLGF